MNNFKGINFQVLNLYPKIDLPENNLVVVKTRDVFFFFHFPFSQSISSHFAKERHMSHPSNIFYNCIVLLDIQPLDQKRMDILKY